MMEVNSGGAYAIKGFNYQRAIITVIMILNYEKQDFKIFVENVDDAEVILENTHTFIQIKSQDLTISKLINTTSKQKQCILDKLINKDEISTIKNKRYKFVCTNFNGDKKNLIAGSFLKEIYCLSDENKTAIKKKLDKINDINYENKLSNTFIYGSPFSANLEIACTYLIGEMNLKNINVDKGVGKSIINELFRLIDQKSEIAIKDSNYYHDKKSFNSNDLKCLFNSLEYTQKREEILKEMGFQDLKVERIKREFISIEIKYQYLKKNISEMIANKLSIKEKTNLVNLTKDLFELVKNTNKNENAIWACLITVVAKQFYEELNSINGS